MRKQGLKLLPLLMLCLMLLLNASEEFPHFFTHKLTGLPRGAFLTEADARFIMQRTADILSEQGVFKDDFCLDLIPESNDINVKLKKAVQKEKILEVLGNVVEYYFQAVQTRTFTLQYADADQVAGLISNIHSPKMFIKQQDGRMAVCKVDSRIDISPDKRTNSIVVTAPLNRINNIQETIAGLDRHTAQVLIKVLIAEVSLDETDQFGLEWNFLEDTFLSNDDQQASAVADFGYQTAAKQEELLGMKYSIITADRLNMLLQALKSSSKIDVLSSPQLVTSDNSGASFEETVKVPVIRTTATATGVISTSVEYQEIGITMQVTPKINIDEYVKLDIDQTIQNILASATVQNAPTFSNRVVRTNVLAKDGHTVIIGGLLKNNETVTRKKVPVLGDLPLVKDLFRRNTKTVEKTELMVFITPRIIRSDRTMKETLKDLPAPALRDKLHAVSGDYFSLWEDAYSREISVLEVSGDRLILNAGLDSGLRTDEELTVSRPGREYFHPLTNQLITVDETEIGRIRVEYVRNESAIASIVHCSKGEKIQEGDLVYRIPPGWEFDDFEILSLRTNLDFAPDHFGFETLIEMTNRIDSPLLKTSMPWQDFSQVVISIKRNGEFHPLRIVKKKNRVQVYFDETVDPGEKVVLKACFREKQNLKSELQRQLRNPDATGRFSMSGGGGRSECSMVISAHFMGSMKLIDFNHQPAVLENPDGTCTLVWTHLGEIMTIRGKIRYRDPAEILNRLFKEPEK